MICTQTYTFDTLRTVNMHVCRCVFRLLNDTKIFIYLHVHGRTHLIFKKLLTTLSYDNIIAEHGVSFAGAASGGAPAACKLLPFGCIFLRNGMEQHAKRPRFISVDDRRRS